MKPIILIIFLFSFISFGDEINRDCKSTREYITSLNFLREHKSLGLEEKERRALADNISQGCSGAAQRFINTTNLLLKAEIPSSLAITTARDISGKADLVAENFSQIFAKIYLEKFFDLPAEEALRLSRNLTLNLDRNPSKVLDDFSMLSDFCLSRKGLDLSLGQCSILIEKIIPQGNDREDSIAKAFIDLFEFLSIDEKGPKLNTLKAMEEGAKAMAWGPNARENFIQAFIFATGPAGLGLTFSQGVEFAQKMATRTVPSPKKKL